MFRDGAKARVARIATFIAASLLAVSGCSSNETPHAKLRQVTLVLDWTPNTNHSGFYLAQAQGDYAREGLRVNIVEPGTDVGLAQVAAGSAQFAVTYAEAILPARAENQAVVSIATILAHNTSSIVVPADRGVTRPAELAGHRYGSYGGPLELALVRRLIECDGGDPTKLRNVDIGNTDFRLGLQRNDYDAVWIFDGWDGVRLETIDGVKLVRFALFGSCIPDWYTPILATSNALITSDSDLVARFVRATQAGFRTASRDPDAAAEALLTAVPELDPALVKVSAQVLADKYTDAVAKQPWGHQDLKVWSKFYEFLRAQKILEKDVDVNQVFTNQFTDAPAVSAVLESRP